MQRTVEQPVPDQRSFRDVMGRFTTGVVLITSATPDGPVGMAANSFTSVSLDPPLVSFGAALTSSTWPLLRAADGFAVSILREDHEQLSRRFSARGVDRFDGTAWERSPAGHPIVPDGLGWLDCVVEVVHPAGDHDLVIARALDWQPSGGGAPLVFHAGRYTRVEATRST